MPEPPKEGSEVYPFALGAAYPWEPNRAPTLSSQLTQVRAHDPLTLLFAGSVLVVVACGAIYRPARHACKARSLTRRFAVSEFVQ